MQGIKETKTLFIKTVNKINALLILLTKGEKTQSNKIRGKQGNTEHFKEIQGIINTTIKKSTLN